MRARSFVHAQLFACHGKQVVNVARSKPADRGAGAAMRPAAFCFDCNIFWAEHPNATALRACMTRIRTIRYRDRGRGDMANEYRAHAHAGMDRAGDGPEAPTGPRKDGSLTIGELARDAGVTLRALRFYQSKGLLTPRRNGSARLFSRDDRERLALILQGKRLGFTLTEIREMLAARARGCNKTLPIDRRKCVEQINMLERQRRDIDGALAELRQIYTEMFVASDFSEVPKVAASGKS